MNNYHHKVEMGCSHFTMLFLHFLPHLPISISSLGFIIQDTILHELLQFGLSHRLFFKNYGNMHPYRVQSFRKRTFWVFHRHQILPEKLVQHGLLSMDCSLLQVMNTCCGDLGSMWSSIDCRRTICFTMVLSTGCKIISVPSARYFFSHLLSVELSFSHFSN